jgi:hypothetical protein
MEKLNLQRGAAARSAELLEMCPPRVPWAFAGANGALTEYV